MTIGRPKKKFSKVWIAAQMRLQKGRCHWCGRVMDTTDRESPLYRTVEHLKPWSKGGTHAPDNCMMACRECNERRGNGDTAEEAEARIRLFLSTKPRRRNSLRVRLRKLGPVSGCAICAIGEKPVDGYHKQPGMVLYRCINA